MFKEKELYILKLQVSQIFMIIYTYFLYNYTKIAEFISMYDIYLSQIMYITIKK